MKNRKPKHAAAITELDKLRSQLALAHRERDALRAFIDRTQSLIGFYKLLVFDESARKGFLAERARMAAAHR